MKENKNLSYLKKQSSSLLIIAYCIVALLILTSINVDYKVTYSAEDGGDDGGGQPTPPVSYTINFKNAEGTRQLGYCKTGEDGRINPSTCVFYGEYAGKIYSEICGSWSYQRCTNGTQYCTDGGNTPNFSSGAVTSQVWTGGLVLYCTAGTSIHDTPKPSSSSEPSSSSPSSSSPSSSSPSSEPSSAPSSSPSSAPSSKPSSAAPSTAKPSSKIEKSCYACIKNGGKTYVIETSLENAITKTGGTNCEAVANKYCETPKNPKTGDIAIGIAWLFSFIGLGCTYKILNKKEN